MKLSVRSEYALRALIALGREHGNGGRVQSALELSRTNNIPKRFLEQILYDLRAAGIIESRRGIAGGYRLVRNPAELTLAELVRHLEGPLAPVGCVSEHARDKCSCPSEQRCALRSVMLDVRDAIAATLENVTLQTLCDRARQLEQHPAETVEYMI